jgi:hypothetical protein
MSAMLFERALVLPCQQSDLRVLRARQGGVRCELLWKTHHITPRHGKHLHFYHRCSFSAMGARILV